MTRILTGDNVFLNKKGAITGKERTIIGELIKEFLPLSCLTSQPMVVYLYFTIIEMFIRQHKNIKLILKHCLYGDWL